VHFRTRYQIQAPAPNGLLFDAFAAGAAVGAKVDERLFAGTSSEFDKGNFVRREVSISELDGESEVEPLFRILSDGTLQFDGAYVDDVRLICRDETYVNAIAGLGEYDQAGVGNYVAFQGTSMAAPHVAGVAALVLAALPGLTPTEAVEAIKAGARPLAALQGKTVTGGTVDARGAIDAALVPPTLAITERPPSLTRNRWPQIGFAANRPASFVCQFSGRPAAPCNSPAFPASRLPDGPYAFVVRATDAAGRSGQSETVTFRVDRTRPRVFFRKRPPRIVRTKHRRARVVFRFRSNEKGVRFVCRVDGGLPRFCKGRLARRFPAGRHVLSVRARDAAGNVTRRPVTYRFRVKRVLSR